MRARRISRLFALVGVVAAAGARPAAQSSRSFDVVSVKVVGPPRQVTVTADGVVGLGMRITSDRVDISHESLLGLLCRAFELRPYQVLGPDWLGDLQYSVDVAATMPPGALPQQVPEMLRTTLVERFGLVTHSERRTMAVYELVVGKDALALRPAVEQQLSFLEQLKGNRSEPLSNGMIRRNFVQTGMDELSKVLDMHLGQPVLNRTGLGGRYDFSVDITRDDHVRNATADAPLGASWIAAMRRLGLELVSKRDPVDVIVVDHMERTPTAN